MPSSLLAPAYALTAGSQRWTEQALAIEVELAAGPGIGRLRASLPPEAPLEAALDDDCRLEIDDVPVFAGIVRSIRRGPTGIGLTAVDAGGRLAAVRPAVTFEKMTAGRIIRDLADDAAVYAGAIDDGVELAVYVADPGRSAWAHMTRLADLSDVMLVVDAEGRVATVGASAAGADAALRYGRDVTGLRHEERGGLNRRVVVAPEAGVGSMSDPAALRPVVDPFSGNRPAGPDAGTLFRFEPALRTSAGAASAAGHFTRVEAAAARPLLLDAWVQPAMRPGQLLELQDLPEVAASGPARVTRVRHRITRAGAATRLVGVREPAGFDPAALIGGLATAASGLP